MPNHLIQESSPYLLQHAHQPVDWYPYSEAIFEKAQQEDKPLIISIGYSTCHWCHVMAHECFDDEEAAELMNKHFINVKVDREELPDVDKYYMNGMQILTGHGGWPLNAFVLPNKKLFYAVTYLPKERWKNLLLKIHQLYQNEKNKLIEYADNIHNGIKQFESLPIQQNNDNYSKKTLNDLIQQVNEWKNIFDKEYGGHHYTPKFVMPINYKFFLYFNYFIKDKELQQHLQNSIQHIILGGLFDHVGGGFYRYSTDKYWKIPHFEKMLYDNAQMIELLSLYYLNFPEPEVKWILEKTINSVLRDFLSDENLFYSAWDADSEGEEGKFYVWELDELKSILKNDYELFSDVFNIKNHFGYWEDDKYVLTIHHSVLNSDKTFWINKIEEWTKILCEHREKRVKPSIDTKIITSWNALMIKALCIASSALKNIKYLEIAEKTAQSILQKNYYENQLYRIYHHQKSKIPAYLDDYAFLIDALIQLAKHTCNTYYLDTAENLAEQCIDKFYSNHHNCFYYTSPQHSIQQSIELFDDVIPSSNAQMLFNLYYLSLLNHNQLFKDIAEKTFTATQHLFFQQPTHTASYGILLLNNIFLNELEVVICGKDVYNYLGKIYPQIWYLNTLFTSSQYTSHFIFQNRFHPEKTFIYVCQHSACYEPIENPDHFSISNYLDM
ncbi:MAG: thioredoxin [Bacteroidia bacterium]|nr:MAG: thioredoxin [Bacteroidia bacterium]